MAATVISFLIGLPFGIKGVAAAYGLSFYVLFGPGLWYAARPIQLRLSTIVISVWKYFVAAAAAGAFCWAAAHVFVFTSAIYHNFNVIERMSIVSCSFLFLYLLLVVIMHGSLDPITRFLSVVSDMLPKGLIKGRKEAVEL